MVLCRTNDPQWNDTEISVNNVVIHNWKDVDDDVHDNGDGFGFVVGYTHEATHLKVYFGQVKVRTRHVRVPKGS
jgi:hypothetical protein